MTDMMTFPDTVEEFMEQYKLVDTKQVYTNGSELVPIFRMKQWFEHLSSAQPEQRWIPVSEGLPKEYGEYICTMENGQVQECGFVPENQRGLVDGWSTCEADGHKSLGYADVLAWMPLPEPWKEGADG